jgi:hypothetical protein
MLLIDFTTGDSRTVAQLSRPKSGLLMCVNSFHETIPFQLIIKIYTKFDIHKEWLSKAVKMRVIVHK